MVDHHPEAVLARAREIAQVTPEERAELAGRQRANRIDEIMAMPVQKEAPAMIRKVNPNALQSKPTDRPETEQEIKERMCRHAADLSCQIMRAVRAQSTTTQQIHEAITPILGEIILVSIANQIKRAELERRIEALERQVKPRIRIAATSTRTAEDD